MRRELNTKEGSNPAKGKSERLLVIHSDNPIGIDYRTTPMRNTGRNTLRKVYLS
jgi:hypothetical protein